MTFTLSTLCSAQQDIKKSRFVAIAAPVTSIEQGQVFLATHIDSSTTHQCWAWKINAQSRVNDAGEPNGTAGRPILAVIDGHELDNIIVLVNRWYGGIKLGTGGLVRAYSSTAQLCLKDAVKIPLITRVTVQFYLQFSDWAQGQYYLANQPLSIDQLSYHADGVEIRATLPADHLALIDARLKQLSAGKVLLKVLDI